MENRTIINVLMVEDNHGDIILCEEAFDDINKSNDLRVEVSLKVVQDGEKAIMFLNNEGQYEKEKTPDLILLDLNIPKINGYEVLDRIKSNDQLKMIPVVVFTTSGSESDIHRSYKSHANSYITKPLSAFDFEKILKNFAYYWLEVSKIPKRT